MQPNKLPFLRRVDPNSVTVSGFSGGGFFASHLHVIYSNVIKGAGIISGGPFGYFMERQMMEATKVKVDNIIPHCFRLRAASKIDPLNNLQNSKVFVFFGKKDDVLAPGVTDKTAEFYRTFGADLKYTVNYQTAHPIPTDLPEYRSTGEEELNIAQQRSRSKVDASNPKFPYINNCGFDVTG